jgi:hypothetical protein
LTGEDGHLKRSCTVRGIDSELLADALNRPSAFG